MIYIGNLVQKMTTTIGIKPCPECERRRKQFNAFQDRIIDVLKKKVSSKEKPYWRNGVKKGYL